MAVQLGNTTTNKLQSAAGSFNATNVSFGLRVRATWSAIGSFCPLYNMGNVYGTGTGGWVLFRHDTTANLYVHEVWNGTTAGYPGPNLTLTDAVWFSIGYRAIGSSWNVYVYNHATEVFTPTTGLTGTRTFTAGPFALGGSHNNSLNAATGAQFEDVWISHTDVPATVVEMWCRGASGRFLVPHLRAYWELNGWVSGDTPDLVGAFPLTPTGTPTTVPGPQLIRPSARKRFPAVAPAVPIYTQTDFWMFNDNGTDLGPPP